MEYAQDLNMLTVCKWVLYFNLDLFKSQEAIKSYSSRVSFNETAKPSSLLLPNVAIFALNENIYINIATFSQCFAALINLVY